MSNAEPCDSTGNRNPARDVGDFGNECISDYIILAEGSQDNTFSPTNFNRYI